MDDNRDKIIYDKLLLERNRDILEHTLLLAVIKSFRFYATVRNRLCPRLPGNKFYRPDFTRQDFNQVYGVAAQFWDTMINRMPAGDMGINADFMELMLAKQVERNYLRLEDAQAITTWLLPDIRTIDLAPDLLVSLPDNPTFVSWLGVRAVDFEQRRLNPASLGHPPTPEDLQASLRTVQSSITATSTRIVSPSTIIPQQMVFAVPFSTLSLPKLDDCLGGYRCGSSYVVGAISGGGKTILAMQLAYEFAMQRINTVVLTTEQPPSELLMRVISNHMSLDSGHFRKRIVDAGKASQLSNVTLPFVPQELWQDPEKYHAMARLVTHLNAHLLFVDWSEGGFNLVNDFDVAIDQLMNQNPGFLPQVIIVDWVGGGLEQKSYQGDKLRFFYKGAGETIINHGKRHKRAMFLMAQLNKTMVKPGTAVVTMEHLAECKSLTDNCAGYIGVTSLRDPPNPQEENLNRLRPMQFLCVDKARFGTGGRVRVIQEFQYQRFRQPLPAIAPHA